MSGMRTISSRLNKKTKSLIIVGLIVLLIVGVLYQVVRTLNAPAQGSINQTPPDKAENIDPYAQPATYNGRYISFTYPAHYKKIPSAITGGYLEVFSLHSTDQRGRNITVGVQKGSLADSSAVAYRRAHPELYTEEPRTRTAVTFTTKSTPEMVSFLQHNDLLANVSITSQSDPNLSEDLQTILNSFAWK